MHTGNSRANSREDMAGAQGDGQLQTGTWNAGMPPMVKRELHPERGNSGANGGGKGRNKRPLLKVCGFPVVLSLMNSCHVRVLQDNVVSIVVFPGPGCATTRH